MAAGVNAALFHTITFRTADVWDCGGDAQAAAAAFGARGGRDIARCSGFR